MNLSTGFSNRSYVMGVLSAVLLFLAAMEWFTRHYIVPIPNTRPYQIHAVYTNRNPNVAVGDSHIYRGFISGDYFLNLGRAGTTIPMINIMLKQYFKNKKPGNIVIEAAPQLFCEEHLQRGALDYGRSFNQTDKFLPFPLYVFDPGIGSHLKRVDSLEGFRSIVRQKNAAQRDIERKGSWHLASLAQRQKAMALSFKYQKPNMASPMATEYVALYKEAVRYVKDRGGKICLLRTPVDQIYLGLQSRDPDCARSIAMFREISREEGLKFVDFQELDMTFGPDKFLNHDHLTPQASREFSPLVHDACFVD